MVIQGLLDSPQSECIHSPAESETVLKSETKGFTMLVLTRHAGQEILLADGLIRLTVLSVTGRRVRLGITAPPEMSVRRSELITEVSPGPVTACGSDSETTVSVLSAT